MSKAKTLIWCHGGCFSGGSVEYDKELRNELSKICRVVPVDFCLDDWNKAIADILVVANSYDEVIIGGISSGGLFAHFAANCLKVPAVLICPVIKPATRHYSLPPDLQSKQLAFFHTFDYMKYIEECVSPPNNTRYIVYGTKDNRAPSSAYEEWLSLDHVVHDALDRGHDICSSPPCDLIVQQVSKLL